MSIINESNIFEKGMLIHLQIGGYKGRMKLSEEQMAGLPTEIVRGVHDLFDNNFKTLLEDINSFDNDVRRAVKLMSVPFPIDGVYFVTSNCIEKLIEFLDTKQVERVNLINQAVDKYDAAVEAFAQEYPAYYSHAQSKSKYLTKEEFAGRFYFKYQFIKITAPDKNNRFISPEMYKLEMKKFKESVNEMKTEVLSIISGTLLEMTGRLKKQCADGKPNQRTFNSLNEFLSRIDNLYSEFVDRDDLKKMIAKVKASTLGVDADALRDSEVFKKQFGKEIGALASEIKALPDIPLKRSIDF